MDLSRVIRALLLVLLLVASSAIAAGFASEDLSAEVPETVSLPALQVGDLGFYNVTFADGEKAFLQATFLGAGSGRDAAGTIQPSIVVQQLWSGPDAWPQEWSEIHHLRADDRAPLGQTTSSPAGGAGSAMGVGVGPLDWIVIGGGVSNTLHATRYQQGGPLCGFLNDLQGKSGSSADPIIAWGTCGGADTIRLQAVGVELMAGVQSTVFEAADGTTLWFHPAVPVPVKVQLLDGFVATLDGFASARENPPDAPREKGEDAPAIDTSPPQPWGLDETGVDHPFPFSSAYQAAMDDAVESGLRDFLASHPDAYVATLAFEDRTEGQHRTLAWRFTVSDGKASQSFQVATESASLEVAGMLLDAPLTPSTSTTRIQSSSGPLPVPADLPNEWPTVKGLLSHWRAFAPDAPAGHSWGYEWTCADASCSEAALHAWAGYDRTREGRDVAQQACVLVCASGDLRQADLLVTDLQGQAVVRLEAEGETWNVAYAEAAGHQVGEYWPENSGPDDPVLAGVWSFPGPAIALPLTLASLLIGLAYLLWPMVKGLPGFALFSRIREDRLLEHPSRRALLDAIAAEPGIHFQELTRRCDLGRGRADHHLRLLENAGIVQSRSGGRYKCYFPARGVDRRILDAAPMLKSPGARNLMDVVFATPGLSVEDAAAAVGVTPGAITYHARRLESCGLLERQRSGRRVLLRPTPGATVTRVWLNMSVQ